MDHNAIHKSPIIRDNVIVLVIVLELGSFK